MLLLYVQTRFPRVSLGNDSSPTPTPGLWWWEVEKGVWREAGTWEKGGVDIPLSSVLTPRLRGCWSFSSLGLNPLRQII